MGNTLFGIDVAALIAEAFDGQLFNVTIVRDMRGERLPGNLTGGRASTAEAIECMGFWDDIDPRGVPAGIDLELNDRKLVLIGDTVPAGGFPRRNDLCTVHEDMGDLSLYAVQPLSRDPAGAVYSFLCRDRKGPDGK